MSFSMSRWAYSMSAHTLPLEPCIGWFKALCVQRGSCYHNQRACSCRAHWMNPGPPNGKPWNPIFLSIYPSAQCTMQSRLCAIYMPLSSSACLDCSPPDDTTDLVSATDVLLVANVAFILIFCQKHALSWLPWMKYHHREIKKVPFL